MEDNAKLEYLITKDLWQQFLKAHYDQDSNLTIRYFWGAICIFIGCLGFGGFYDAKPVAGLLLATGFWGVLSKQLLILRSLRNASRHPYFGKQLAVSLSAQKLTVTSGNTGYSQPWDNFVGYRHLAPGFLLYHDRNAFFFIPASVITENVAKRLKEILNRSGVNRLK